MEGAACFPPKQVLGELGPVIEEEFFTGFDSRSREEADSIDSVHLPDKRVDVRSGFAAMIDEPDFVAVKIAVDLLFRVEVEEISGVLLLIDSTSSISLLPCDDFAFVFANKVVLFNTLPGVKTHTVDAAVSE